MTDKAEHSPILARTIRFAATLAALAIVVVCVAIWFGMSQSTGEENAIPVDFSAFWAAARLAVEGRGEAAFSDEALASMLRYPGDAPVVLSWLYPPTWAMLVAPLGLVPFWAAWIVFALVSIAVYLGALQPWAGRVPGGIGLLLCAPVLLIGAFNGNNGLLMAGVAAGALWQMKRDRPVAAGALIAILSAKPTLGVLLPVAFIAGGRWRTITWSAVFTLAFAALAAWFFGISYWETFFRTLATAAEGGADGYKVTLDYQITWYGFGRAFGWGHGTATGVQLVASLIVFGAVGWFWATGADFTAKAAVLMVAIPLATPYSHYYELTFPLAGAVLWSFAGHARRLDEIAVIAALWLMPIFVPLTQTPVLPLLAAPVSSFLMAMMLIRADRCTQS